MAHGSGGRMARSLIESVVLKYFSSELLAPLPDSAVLGAPANALAFTTDSYVIRPLFFPGGDIGRLAVCGTVNDLAVTGARPVALSCGLIIEEGFPIAGLERILMSMREALDEAGVEVVTGDTKVVERGAADGIFINTSGIGEVFAPAPGGIETICAGDCIVCTGSIGDHGAAILASREEFDFETVLESDCAPVLELSRIIMESAPRTCFMRDPTRGGVSATVSEIAAAGHVGIDIVRADLPVKPEVGAVAALLGLDPLHIANEGKIIAVVPPDDAGAVVENLRRCPAGAGAAIIGRVTDEHPGIVTVKTETGGSHILQQPAAEHLPRIC